MPEVNVDPSPEELEERLELEDTIEAGDDVTMGTAAEYEAHVRPFVAALEQRIGYLEGQLEQRTELELSAEQVTRLFKNLTVQSCQASLDGAIQWDFAGGIIVRFAVAPDGTGFFRGLIAP